MYEGEELTPEVIAKYMQTPEGALELQQIMVEMEQYQGPGIGDTDLTGSMDVPTGGPPLSAIGVRAGGADNMRNRDSMLQELLKRRPSYQGTGY
jgi:hypothetical protein|tara:strand:+ start:2295 stop:2576 length:282 start_codon:yes stop_codon:yes gene_type:complete